MPELDFYSEQRGLYTTHYRAEGGRFLIMLPPLFEELTRTRKLMINLARGLAEKGVNVVRFDYRGTGLSDGRFNEFNLSGAALDIEEAVSYCKKAGATDVQLLGFRFGGYLAIKYLSEHGDIRKAILWEPILDLKLYWEELMRIAIANQLVTFGAVKQGKEELLTGLKETGGILIDGYQISFQAYRDFVDSGAYPSDRMAPLKDRTSAIFWHNKKTHEQFQGAGLRSYLAVTDKPSWDNIRHVNYRFPELFNKTMDEAFL